MIEFSNGFRILDNCSNERRLVDWQAAFRGHASCDARAEVSREAYLSAFTFGSEFRQYLEVNRTTRGYRGPTFAPWLWFDIDRAEDLEAATRDAQRLCAATVERYGMDGDALLIFFSGSKGYHIGLPSTLWAAEPSGDFHRVARQFAEQLASRAGVTIDTAVYDRVRAFRAPNSRHPKTGRHKRRLEYGELLHVTTSAILERASHPEPFELPADSGTDGTAVADWQQAAIAICQEQSAAKQRVTAPPTALNRLTIDFIRDGARPGERARRLFSAAANLAEFGCSRALAQALLSESARNSGLKPSEVTRQIESGLSHVSSRIGGTE